MKLLIEGQKISSFDSPPIRLVAGSSEFVPIELQCSSEWDGLLVTVQFIQQGKTISKYIGEARILNVPADISAGWLMITCFGAKTDTEVFGTVNGYETEVYPAGLSSTKQEPIPPTPNLYNQLVTEVKKYADEAQESADKVEEAQQTAQEAKNLADTIQDNAEAGLYNGKDGTNGTNGVDGVSPTVSIEEIVGGTRVDITDVNGPHSFDVMNGVDGESGTKDWNALENKPFKVAVPGDSPTVNVPNVLNTLEPGAYVFNSSGYINFSTIIDGNGYGRNYEVNPGDLLYIGVISSGSYKGKKALNLIRREAISCLIEESLFVYNIGDSIWENNKSTNLIASAMLPLFYAKPGQLVSVKSADVENLTLEFSGTDLPTVLPNPNALTIKIGSESVVYDGSSAQIIEIADGNEVAY